MKRLLLVGPSAILAVTLLTAGRWQTPVSNGSSGGGGGGGGGTVSGGVSGGGDGGGRGYGRVRAARPSVVIKMRQYHVPRPAIIQNSREIIRDQQRVAWPQRDEHGAQIVQTAAIGAPQHHTMVVRNPAVIRDIQRQQRVEVVPNRYYWHDVNGFRYAHRFEGGIHWYGFYHGPTFYWTRYYGNRWWWFDTHFDRWVYWYDGFWWWPSPAGEVYVYVDNNYYPYDHGVVTSQQPEVQAPPQNAPSTSGGNSSTSPDGKRTVQVIGANGEAFLYDNSGAHPVFIKYIGEGVEKIRFSGGTNAKPLQILVDFKDGTFALYNADGNPVENPETSAADIPPMAEPPSAPPPQ